MPMPKRPGASLRYHTYPRFVSTSRVKKKVCGGGNVASEAPLPSATSTRLAAFNGTIVSLVTPPNS